MHGNPQAVSPTEAQDEVRRVLAELESAGVNTQSLAKMLERQWGTVANWKKTGRIERYDWDRLSDIHRQYVIIGDARSAGIPRPA